jgi:lysozyme
MVTLVALLKDREGNRLDVYPDSKGLPTVGIGHLVVAADKLKLGDTIDEARLMAFFKKDSAEAISAAKSQASKAGISDGDFIVYLTSVNFQLGSDWYKEHKKTWSLIMDGQYSEAAAEVKKSRWHSQTPVRTKDFMGALLKLKDKPAPKGK